MCIRDSVRDEFGPDLFILDGGPCELGLESTTVDLSRGAPSLLRPGAVTREDIGQALGAMPRDRDADAPRASGTLAAHYAPRLALSLVSPEAPDAEVRAFSNVAVLALRAPPKSALVTQWIAASGHAPHYGHHLYANPPVGGAARSASWGGAAARSFVGGGTTGWFARLPERALDDEP